MSNLPSPEFGERTVVVESNAHQLIGNRLAEAILSMSLVVVTGRPLIVWGEPVAYYNQNKIETDVKLRLTFVHLMRIPIVGHRHLDDCFIGEYPAINGIDEETGHEYMFGAKPELGFEYEL